MESQLIEVKKFLRTGIGSLIVVLLVIGIFFRFVNLDHKVYWLDETHTSLRIFGYTEPEFIEDIFNGEVVYPQDLLNYQVLSQEKGWGDSIRVLAGNTEHTPLYYLLLRLWTGFFGSSVAAIRSLSAFLSLLTFPAIYWLCRELFNAPMVGWLAIALVAVSPFHILYAQEARPYTLLAVAALTASAAFLRALRLQTKGGWALYTVTVALGSYSHWFFGCVGVAHGLYLLIREKFRPTKTFLSYLLSSVIALILFSPWIITTVTGPPALEEQMGWVYQRMPLTELARSWALSVSRVFLDWDLGWCFPGGDGFCRYLLGFNNNYIFVLVLPLVALVAYALYFVGRRTPPRVWLFLYLIIAVMAAALVIPDLLEGGQRSSVTRYLIPSLLGFQLAVAYLLAQKLFSASLSRSQRLFWQGVFVVVLTLGIISSSFQLTASAGWTKGGNYHTAPIAKMVNETEKPLVLYSVPNDVLWGKGGAVGRVMPLIRLFRDEVGILFVIEPEVPAEIPEGYDDIFLYRPHEELKEDLEADKNYIIEPAYFHPVDKQPRLWKLER